MIQSILFFALGFLCAGFLTLMIAPAVWRRTIAMTRKRVEASVPLSLAEIQADKDRIRAEFAMSVRKLEMSLKSLREKSAAQSVEIGRGREELRLLAADLAGKNQLIAELEARGAGLSQQLQQRQDEVRRLTEDFAEAERQIERRSVELDELGRMYEEASFLGSSRQIELVARESEVEKLSDDVALLQNRRKDADKRLQELLSTLADREEKLERSDRELTRLVEEAGSGSASEGSLSTELTNARKENAQLRAALAERATAPAAGSGDSEEAIARSSSERDRLEARLTILTRENRKLKSELAAPEHTAPQGSQDGQDGDALLREQLGVLAAEVVNLTRKLEGPGSPIEKALAMPVANPGAGAGGDKIISLADRVRALREGKSAG